MADKLKYNPNNDTQNYPFCRLQLVDQAFGHSIKSSIATYQNSIKVPKVVKPKDREMLS